MNKQINSTVQAYTSRSFEDDGQRKESAKMKGEVGITPTPQNSVSHFCTPLPILQLDSPTSTAPAKDACTGHTSLPVKLELEYYTYHIDSYASLDKFLESLRNALQRDKAENLVIKSK